MMDDDDDDVAGDDDDDDENKKLFPMPAGAVFHKNNTKNTALSACNKFQIPFFL